MFQLSLGALLLIIMLALLIGMLALSFLATYIVKNRRHQDW